MMKTHKIIKNQKPVAIDLHFKYRCPNSECSNVHWLSLVEAKTKNFKMVCYCGCVFTPKRIKNIKINYSTKKTVNTKIETPIEAPQPKKEIPPDTLDHAANILKQCGFTKKESEQLILDAFLQYDTLDTSELVKLALKTFGENQHGK